VYGGLVDAERRQVPIRPLGQASDGLAVVEQDPDDRRVGDGCGHGGVLSWGASTARAADGSPP
jgi:hypothetical protein